MADTTRDLIQRLTEELDTWLIAFARAIIAADRARTVLAQPEPEGLTDEELETDFLCWYKDRYSTAYFGAVPLAVLIAWTQFDRARWGRPAIEPEANGQT